MAKSTSNLPLQLEFQEQELDVMDRVLDNETFTFLKIQEKLKNIIKIQNSLKSSQILAKKEFYKANEKDIEEEEPVLDEEKLKEKIIQLREEKDQLHKTLITHQSLSTSLQEAVFQNQIQNNFYKCLKEKDIERPEMQTTIQNYNETLLKSSELVDAFKEKEKLDKEILQARLKYRQLLDSIEDKWKILNNLESKGGNKKNFADNPDAQAFQDKLTKREERLQLLTYLLQNCIASSGEIWGANPRLVEIMLLCDGAFNIVRGTEDIEEGISQLRLERDKMQRKSKEKFISSTPR